jgi:hypothetical protein
MTDFFINYNVFLITASSRSRQILIFPLSYTVESCDEKDIVIDEKKFSHLVDSNPDQLITSPQSYPLDHQLVSLETNFDLPLILHSRKHTVSLVITAFGCDDKSAFYIFFIAAFGCDEKECLARPSAVQGTGVFLSRALRPSAEGRVRERHPF